METRGNKAGQVQVWLSALSVPLLAAALSCGTAEEGVQHVVTTAPMQAHPEPPLDVPLVLQEPSSLELVERNAPEVIARCAPSASGSAVEPLLTGRTETHTAWLCPEEGHIGFGDGFVPIHKNPVFVANASGEVTSLGTLELAAPLGTTCPMGLVEEVLPIANGACFLEFQFDTDCCDASGSQGVRLRCAVGPDALSDDARTLEVMLSTTHAEDVLRAGCLDTLEPDGELRDCYERTYETSDRRDFYFVEEDGADLLCIGARDGVGETGPEAWRLGADGIEEVFELPPACDALAPAKPEERRR